MTFHTKSPMLAKNQSPSSLPICPSLSFVGPCSSYNVTKLPQRLHIKTLMGVIHNLHFLKCTLHNRSACVLRPQINYSSEFSCCELCSVHMRFKCGYSWLTRIMLQNIHSHKIFIEFSAANEKQTEQRQLSSRNVA